MITLVDEERKYPVLQCLKCSTEYVGIPGKDYSAGVLCAACRRQKQVLVGVCHPTGELLTEKEMRGCTT